MLKILDYVIYQIRWKANYKWVGLDINMVALGPQNVRLRAQYGSLRAH